MTAGVVAAGARCREWRAGRIVDVVSTLGCLRRGTADPAHVIAAGRFWWAARTPAGDGTLAVSSRGDCVDAAAWGAGADWLLDRVPQLLGCEDDWSGLDVAGWPRLAGVLRSRAGMRLCSTGLIMDALVPAVLEQKVTGGEARRAWRHLLRRYGTPAPGPTPVPMAVPPAAETLLAVPAWDWHRFGVDGKRVAAIRACATVAGRLEEASALPPDAAVARLRVVPGVGEWTAAETVQRALGHPDAVSVGDYHLKNWVVHHFTGRARGTDAEMLECLAPWTGQRQRVVRLVELSGLGAPRFGPRFAPTDMRRM